MNPDKPQHVPPPKPLQQVADELVKDLVAAFQETDPERLAELERREQEREADLAEAVEQLRREGQTPGLKGKKLPPRAG